MKHAQTYYCKSNTLGSKIKLAYDSNFLDLSKYAFYSDKKAAPVKLIPPDRTYALKYFTKKYIGSADLMVFFDIDTNIPKKDGVAGVAYLKQVCQWNNDLKWSMNEWFVNDVKTTGVVRTLQL